jgi:hypothetical protein
MVNGENSNCPDMASCPESLLFQPDDSGRDDHRKAANPVRDQVPRPASHAILGWREAAGRDTRKQQPAMNFLK